MIKGLISLVILVSVWFLWAVIGNTPCARIERGASPVRAVMEGVHWALKPWASMENNLMLISWSIKSDQFTRALFSHQFYGKSLSDGCPNVYSSPSNAPPIVPATPAAKSSEPSLAPGTNK